MARTRRLTAGQREIDFGLAEGTHAERKNRLGLALLKVEADLYLSRLAGWVFESTGGGLEGELLKSYADLAARPWGLCCSRSKVRTTVSRAVRYRILSICENRFVSFGQRANGYSIDWRGVSDLLHIGGGAGALTEHPHALTEHPHALTEHPFKEQLAFPDGTLSGPAREGPAPRPPPVDFGSIPELAQASTCVEPLPAGALAYGIFSDQVLRESYLAEAAWLVVWFRRMLGSPRPVCAATEAELLLVIAAGLHAKAIPQAEVRKNRCAVFAHVVGRAKFAEVLSYVPAARFALDDVLRDRPDALTCGDGVVRVLSK